MIIIFCMLLFVAIVAIGLIITAIKTFIVAFCDAWRNYNPDVSNDDTSEIDENIDQYLLDEIDHLKTQKDGYIALHYELEKRLEYADEKQRITIKRQLLTLDNKTFSIDKKINKLLEKLE